MENYNSRKLVMVLSQAQLMLAVQMKLKNLCSESVDLILASSRLYEIYKNRKLEKIFNHVYYTEDRKLSKIDLLIAFFSPFHGIRQYVKLDPDQYEDIFFWNPTWLYYYLHKYSVKRKRNYRWHIISDAASSFIAETPEIKPRYKLFIAGYLLNLIDKIFFRYGEILDQKFDIYTWQPRFVMYETKHELVEVPSIDCTDKDFVNFLNSLFNYTHKDIKEKIIFLDKARDDIYDNKDILRIIKNIVNVVGSNNIIIKKHPREKKELYDELGNGVKIINDNFPWELYCLNEERRDRVIIGYYSSSLVLPYIIFGCTTKTYSIAALITKHVQEIDQYYNKLFYDMADKTKCFYEVNSMDSLVSELKK